MARQVGETLFIGSKYGGNGYVTREGKAYFHFIPGPDGRDVERKACFARTRAAAARYAPVASWTGLAWRLMPQWMRGLGERYAYGRITGALSPRPTPPKYQGGGHDEDAAGYCGFDVPRGNMAGLDLSGDRVMPHGVVLASDEDAKMFWLEGLEALGEYMPNIDFDRLRVRLGLYAVCLQPTCSRKIVGGNHVSQGGVLGRHSVDSGWRGLLSPIGLRLPSRMGKGRWLVFVSVGFGVAGDLPEPSERWLAFAGSDSEYVVADAFRRVGPQKPVRRKTARGKDGITLLSGLGGLMVGADLVVEERCSTHGRSKEDTFDRGRCHVTNANRRGCRVANANRRGIRVANANHRGEDDCGAEVLVRGSP